LDFSPPGRKISDGDIKGTPFLARLDKMGYMEKMRGELKSLVFSDFCFSEKIARFSL